VLTTGAHQYLREEQSKKSRSGLRDSYGLFGAGDDEDKDDGDDDDGVRELGAVHLDKATTVRSHMYSC
jgi:hypothetical protein